VFFALFVVDLSLPIQADDQAGRLMAGQPLLLFSVSSVFSVVDFLQPSPLARWSLDIRVIRGSNSVIR
jgi:hypothetical protein